MHIPARRKAVVLILAIAIKPKAQSLPRLDAEIIPARRQWFWHHAKLYPPLLFAAGNQALVQIFDNAVKYSPPDSQVTVAARARDGRMVLSVSDQGTGLTPADEAKMWDRFVRGDRHAATTSGSGLGLWIASAFVAANGGTMNAVSDGPGLGTTLAIELPVTQVAVPQMESDADE